jgi:hypothetical protein
VGGIEMSDTPKWVIVVVVVLLVVGLVAFSRGRQHHRGDEVGERAGGALAVRSVVVTEE